MKHLKMYEENIEDIKIVLDTCIFNIYINNIRYSAWYHMDDKRVREGLNMGNESRFITDEERDMLTKICNEHIDEMIKI